MLLENHMFILIILACVTFPHRGTYQLFDWHLSEVRQAQVRLISTDFILQVQFAVFTHSGNTTKWHKQRTPWQINPNLTAFWISTAVLQLTLGRKRAWALTGTSYSPATRRWLNGVNVRANTGRKRALQIVNGKKVDEKKVRDAGESVILAALYELLNENPRHRLSDSAVRLERTAPPAAPEETRRAKLRLQGRVKCAMN